MTSVHHTTVTVPIEMLYECADWYDALGLTRIESYSSHTVWYQQGLHLYGLSGGTQAPTRGTEHPRHVALSLGIPMYQAHRNLAVDGGYFIEDASDLWGAYRCWVRDPAGNRVELMEWGP